MSKPFTTVRVYPEDNELIEAVRVWLQRLYGADHSKADAVHYALLNLHKINPSINQPATTGEE